MTCFDPRPRTGGDRPVIGHLVDRQGVSIHAPARGATDFLAKAAPDQMFRSTPPHGGDSSSMKVRPGMYSFRSTPPHGGRPAERDG